ncbi:MAG: hypothetical protein Q9226_003506 [Calogaya cf. arnoldii]
MANHAEAAIFRRYDSLNLENLLYMQAELVDLEDQLNDTESEDNPKRVQLSSSVQDLRKYTGTQDNDQWLRFKEVQGKMRVYNDALLQYLSLRKVAKPTPNDINVLRDWLEQDTGGALS